MAPDRTGLAEWSALWRRLGARSDPGAAYGVIAGGYAEPHRHYHTLEHIARTLQMLDGVRGSLLRPDEAELAVWLHDVVYAPRAADNEARSAGYAARLLADGGAAPDIAPRVAAIILATRHAAPPEEPDARHVVDADLSILAAPAADFDRYERQVRQEYAFRGEAEWRQGRARLLGAFLARPRIYLTADFAALEAPARANLARSLARLSPPAPG